MQNILNKTIDKYIAKEIIMANLPFAIKIFIKDFPR